MKVKKFSKGLMITISLGVVILATSAYASTCEAPAPGTMVPLVASAQPAQSGAVVLEWNQHAVALTLLPAFALAPVQQTRVMAIIQIAVHDAVNGITGDYETYLSPGPAPENASPEAAAIAAAHHTLKNLFPLNPTQAASLDAAYANSLAAHGLSALDPGIEYGRSAAAAILASRANDNSAQAQFEYTAPGAGLPGIWVRLNNAPALLPGWGNVTPFVLRSGSQFRPDAPPTLDSEQYARDYNEIYKIGVLNGSTRTDEQTQIANFWRGSPTAIWNPVLAQVIAARDLDLSATARSFALLYLASADASIACWDAKYTYNFWRPMPAIRSGDLDGNDFTAGDLAWSPLLATPPHPEYPSGHSTNSSAMAKILELLFGDDPGAPVVVTLTGITRQWDTFSEGVDEVIEARIYSGIHFRTADEVGARLGRQVARFVSTHALRRCPKGGSRCS
ncbi:MAG TPA: vanadium-dependent haloperoxidase [Pyrinomonadaceae bacterium]|nr:vanadium-dependent haloperoxidase [Pyrinomonadaceae bacterium]